MTKKRQVVNFRRSLMTVERKLVEFSCRNFSIEVIRNITKILLTEKMLTVVIISILNLFGLINILEHI